MFYYRYKQLARKWHPDKVEAAERAAAEEKFKQISASYMVLKNPLDRSPNRATFSSISFSF